MVGTVWWGSILLQGPNLGSTSPLQSFVQSWSTLREEGHPQMFWLLEGSELDTFQICKWPNPLNLHSKGCVGVRTLFKWVNGQQQKNLPLITIPGTFFALLESESDYCDYWGEKAIINLPQFEATNWPKHNRQWTKLLKIMALVWQMQIWIFLEERLTNATNVTLHLLRQAIWGHIWNYTVGKSQTNVTSVTLHPHWQAIWGYI